jgi:uncharacterized protein Yka (UPF0111/DUF47 family)
MKMDGRNMEEDEIRIRSPILYLLKIVDRFGCVADHAENAGNRIGAMLAK